MSAATAGVIKKPPAFSTPMYSNSYLPAAMQIIYHAVEQLKQLQSEEISQENLTIISSSTTPSMKDTQPESTTTTIKYPQTQSTTPSMKHPQSESTISPIGYSQPQSTTSTMIFDVTVVNTAVVHDEKIETPQVSSNLTQLIEVSSQGSSQIYGDLMETTRYLEISTVNVLTACNGETSSEMNEETVETNYVTPETNHESPEPVQEFQESNQEIPEKNEETKFTIVENFSSEKLKPVASRLSNNVSQQQSTRVSVAEVTDSQKKKGPTIDSVVGEIYGIVKSTTSPLIEESDPTNESKEVTGISIEKMESIEDDEEETRFTLLGEKVSQVPRPSLNSYLRRTKVPPRAALQQLANLYDSLSKDARKQGYARYTGYSDQVLKTLETSAEGGVGPQLKKLLANIIERNELTRDDAKMKTCEALRDLDNPGSALSKDLRRLLPLRYTA